MKILWFTNTACSAGSTLKLNNNSGGWLSSLEAEISKKSGIELHVAFYYNQAIDPFFLNSTFFHPIYQKNNKSKIERYFSRLFNRENNNLELNDLTTLIEKVNPDIIHIHGTEENFGLIIEKVKIPVIISIQGVINSIIEKYYSGLPASIVKKMENISDKLFLRSINYQFNVLKIKGIRERKILKATRFVIGRTSYDKRITRLLSPNSEYFTVNEILRPKFYINEWNKTNFSDIINIVTILSDCSYKGFETILKTAEILKSFDRLKFKWLVIGIDNKSKMFNITTKHLRLNIDSVNVELLGILNENEIVEVFKKADIYCQVSHIENSPNSLSEALLMGVPSIGSFAGGTSSLLENFIDGLLVQDGDPYALAGALYEMISNFEMALVFSKNARKKALIRHDKASIVDNLLNVYKSISQKNRVM